MKRLLLLSFFICFAAFGLMAQQHTLPAIYESADQLNERYQLDEEQQVELTRILENRTKNFQEIEPLLNSDQMTYWMKRKAIYQGEQASILLILKTEAQRTAHTYVRRAVRLAESKLIQGYLAEGKSRDEARFLLLQNKY